MPNAVRKFVEKDNAPTTYKELIKFKISQLENSKRKLLTFDKMDVTQGVAIISAVALNVSLKRSLLLYEGAITTAGFVALGAYISNFGLNFINKERLLSDPALCNVCAGIRGGVIQGFSSTVFPLGLSFAMTAIVGERYKSVEIPSFTWGNRSQFLKFWVNSFKPMKSVFLINLGLQSVFGFYYAYQRKTLADEVHASVTAEEMSSLISAQLHETELLRKYSG